MSWFLDCSRRIATYLDTRKDLVTLYFGFGSLLDGTTYPASITLTAPSKHLQVAFSLEKLNDREEATAIACL